MGVDVADADTDTDTDADTDADTGQAVAFDQAEHFGVGRGECDRQIGQGGEECGAILERAECEFADDPGVDQDVSAIEVLGEDSVAGAEMVDPDRGIGENQPGSD